MFISFDKEINKVAAHDFTNIFKIIRIIKKYNDPFSEKYEMNASKGEIAC